MSWSAIIKRAAPTLIVLLLIAYFTDGLKAVPMALVAWGTILLAFATWLSIKSSNEREDKRRIDEINRERRQRDKAELDNIRDWVLKLATCKAPINISVWMGLVSDEPARRYLSAEFFNLSQRFDNVLSDSLYVEKMAYVFGDSLFTAVEAFIVEIREHIRIINKCLDLINKSDFNGFKVAEGELNQHFSSLTSSQDAVVKELVDINVSRLDI